jgi:L-fuconolactonase
MTVIDAHHHVWDLSVRDQDWITGSSMAAIRRTFTIDDLLPHTRSAGIDATVVVQTVPVAEETPEMLALAASSPLVAGVVGWTDLASPRIADSLARLAALPGGEYLVSIRHPVEYEQDPDWLRRPDVIRGLRAVAAAGLCYDVLAEPHQIPAASYAAAAVPGLTMVLDHAGKPPIGTDLSGWTAAIAGFAALPNTVCKLSGLVTEAPDAAPPAAFSPVADVVLDVFGAARVMFGSDWPVCLLASSYDGVNSLARSLVAALPETERAAVFGGTAARVYGIGDRLGDKGAGAWR